MRINVSFIVATLLISGCSSYGIWDAPGIKATTPDNPKVVVTSDVELIRVVGAGPQIDMRTDPPLAISFEHALEKYVSEGQFRIIEAEMTQTTFLYNQHVSFAMIVEANGRTYQTKYEWHTTNAGFIGNKPIGLVPEYLDGSAKQLAEKLKQ